MISLCLYYIYYCCCYFSYVETLFVISAQDMDLLSYSERRIVCDVQLGQQRGAFGKFLTIAWTDHMDTALMLHMNMLANDNLCNGVGSPMHSSMTIPKPVAENSSSVGAHEVSELQVRVSILQGNQCACNTLTYVLSQNDCA